MDGLTWTAKKKAGRMEDFNAESLNIGARTAPQFPKSGKIIGSEYDINWIGDGTTYVDKKENMLRRIFLMRSF